MSDFDAGDYSFSQQDIMAGENWDYLPVDTDTTTENVDHGHLINRWKHTEYPDYVELYLQDGGDDMYTVAWRRDDLVEPVATYLYGSRDYAQVMVSTALRIIDAAHDIVDELTESHSEAIHTIHGDLQTAMEAMYTSTPFVVDTEYVKVERDGSVEYLGRDQFADHSQVRDVSRAALHRHQLVAWMPGPKYQTIQFLPAEAEPIPDIECLDADERTYGRLAVPVTTRKAFLDQVSDGRYQLLPNPGAIDTEMSVSPGKLPDSPSVYD